MYFCIRIVTIILRIKFQRKTLSVPSTILLPYFDEILKLIFVQAILLLKVLPKVSTD